MWIENNKTMEEKHAMLKPGMKIGNVDSASVLHIAEIVTVGDYDEKYSMIDVTVKNAVTEHGDTSKKKYWVVSPFTKIEAE